MVHDKSAGGEGRSINFMDCVSDYFKTQQLDADNTLTCESCGKQNRSQIHFKIKTRKFNKPLTTA